MKPPEPPDPCEETTTFVVYDKYTRVRTGFMFGPFGSDKMRRFARRMEVPVDWDDDLEGTFGVTLSTSTRATTLVWMPRPPKSLGEVNTLSHEIVHALLHTLKAHGYDDEELFATLQGEWLEEALRKCGVGVAVE